MENLESKIESLLFVSPKPLPLKQLADILNEKIEKVKEILTDLELEYKEKKRGIQIIKDNDKYQMVSSPDNFSDVQKLIKDEVGGELSRPSLETLTIIAYRGPISKMDLDRIRGVNCSMILRNLLLRGLIEVEKNKKTETNYYRVTFDFIRFLGINDIKELPDYEKLHVNESLNSFLERAE
jgi:segregation and condensation protein B